jgi:orotidine-5'-phosphate decarboxylase
MDNFADRLIAAIKAKGNPCIVGLDPRIDQMPTFVTRDAVDRYGDVQSAIRGCIIDYHRRIIDRVAELVPGVKLQIAFYEQYGIPGLLAFNDTVEYAKNKNLIVIIDAKRNDIASTAQAYANAFLGRTSIFGHLKPIIDADCVTVSPYLGRDSLEPFVETCKNYGKGIFILAKTSNPGSGDLQDLKSVSGEEIYMIVAKLVRQYSIRLIGKEGYSAIGTVVGATFPAQAIRLREMLPKSIFLVPGYGAQGATASDVAHCFNGDGLGAVVNASRSLTYGFESLEILEHDFEELIRKRILAMITEISEAIAVNMGSGA